MNHDLEKLLGGFAADTLTTEEKQQLYRAALHDQTLFDTLADEQALKELLTDPAVRRRLLQSLQKTSSATAEDSSSWFDWFRRPAGLAWSGGIAGAVLAVVLGTSLYQESLRQEARFTAKEGAQPSVPPRPIPTPPQLATPPTNESPVTSAQKSRSSLPPLRGTLTNKTPSKTPPSSTTRDEQRAHRVEHDALEPHAEIETVQTQIKQSSKTLPTSTDESTPSALQRTASASSPSPLAATAPQSQSGVDSAMPPQDHASLSARSLFYGTGPQGPNRSIAPGTQRPEKAASESGQSSNQPEFTTQPLAIAKSKRAVPQYPVGIRYSLTSEEPSEPLQERGIGMDMPEMPKKLTIESNQDGFLQVWNQDGSSNPQLLFPISETDQPRSKLTAHTPLTISVPSTPNMLVIRFSRTDTVPSVTFDRTLLNDSTRHQLRESVLTDEISSFPPPIHYIINQDPSLSEIIVHISPSQP